MGYKYTVTIRRPGQLNVSEYARHRGCDRQSVVNAIQDGRLTERSCQRERDKWLIDPILGDLEWPNQNVNSEAMSMAIAPDLDHGGQVGFPSFGESKAKKEYFLAEKARLELETLAGSLVSAEAMKREFFDVGREIREAIRNIPVRIVDKIVAIPFNDPERRFKVLTILETELTQSLLILCGRENRET